MLIFVFFFNVILDHFALYSFAGGIMRNVPIVDQ